MLVRHRDRRLPGEGRLSGDELVEDDTERIDVRAVIRRHSLGLLRAEVGGGPDHGAGPGELLGVVESAGDAEIGDLHRAVPGQHDVARFDVAVIDTGLVGHRERTGGIGCYLCGAAGEQRPLGAPDVTQRPTRNELHHHVVGVPVLTEVVDAHDVGVGEVGGGLGFPLEPGDERIVRGELGMQDLDRDGSAQAEILGLEHVGHPPSGEMTRDAVTPGQDAGVRHNAKWYRRPGFLQRSQPMR